MPFMNIRGGESNDADGYDLQVLNFYVLLDALRRQNADLRRRILAHWETFQHLQAVFDAARRRGPV